LDYCTRDGAASNPNLADAGFSGTFDGSPASVKPLLLLGEHAALPVEHTTEVFGDWLGMSAGDVAVLRRAGVV